MIQCDKCGGKIFDDSAFCPHCGDPVTEVDLPVADLVADDVARVEIRFGRSSSASYEQAVAICQNIPSYATDGEGNGLRHQVTLPITEIELLINLWELVGSWKSSRMLINGQPATKSALVYKGAGCYRERQKAYDKNQYCFGERQYDVNIWGCKKLGMPITEWGGGWIDYGAIDNQGVWHFDKDRIQHDLEVAMCEQELCPALNRQRILDTLAKIPDTVNPRVDKNWAYRTTYQEIRGDYKEVAVGVKPVMKRVNSFVLGSYRPSWNLDDISGEAAASVIRVSIDPQQPVGSAGSNGAGKQAASGSCLLVVLSGLAIVLASVGLASMLSRGI
jgi:hypothetical protein